MDKFLIETLGEACNIQYIQDNPDAVLGLMVEAIAEINRLKGICESYALQYGTVTDKEYFIRRAKIEAVKAVVSRLKDSLEDKTEPIDDYDLDMVEQEMMEEING